MNEYEELPEGYEADIEEFNELYVVAWLLIIQALMRLLRLPPNPTTNQLLTIEREVKSEINAIVVNLERKAVQVATTKITEAYGEGVKYSRLALTQDKKIISEVNEVEDVEEIVRTLPDTHQQRLDAMIKQSQDDLLKATGNTHNNIKKLVRQFMSKEMAGTYNSGKIGKTSHMAVRMEQQLKKQFLESGIKDVDVAIIDKANRKWKLKTYSEMAVRTKINDSYIQAIRIEALHEGYDLAIISTKPDTHDECLNYEGMIISLNGLTSGYLTYEGIKTTKKCFHPNCGHFLRPIGGIEWVPVSVMQKHKRQMNKYETK